MPQRHEDMGAGAYGFKATGEDDHGSRTRKNACAEADIEMK